MRKFRNKYNAQKNYIREKEIATAIRFYLFIQSAIIKRNQIRNFSS